MKLGSGITLMLLVLLATIAACSGDDEPVNNDLIIGEATSADFFQTFTPPRTVALQNEQRGSGFNVKEYQDTLDLDQDGTIDMVLNYKLETRINGDSLMVTGMIRQADKLILLGDSVEWNGDFFWDRALFSKGEVIGLNYGYWQVTSEDAYTFDVYQYDSNSRQAYKRTAFDDSQTGYVVFQYYRGNDILLGWIQLSITGNQRVPQTDSFGYKTIAKID